MLAHLAPIAAGFIATAYDGHRAMAPTELAAHARLLAPTTLLPSLDDAIAEGLTRATPDTPLLITGSIYLAGEARERVLAAR